MKQLTILLATTALLISAICQADRVVTTRKKLIIQPTPTIQESLAPTDTITTPQTEVRFCGYEKALNASRETIFIQNLTDTTILAICLTIEYLDSSKRSIHKRSLRLQTDIPPHQTRRYDLKSWDTQKSYYYINGSKPRKTATPYDVTITPDTIFTILAK